MRKILFAIALVSSTAALAQATYTPPEVRITRTHLKSTNQTGGHVTCFTGTIKVTKQDDVIINLNACRPGTVRSITSVNQTGGTVGTVINVNSNGVATVDSSEVGTTGVEDAIVRRCLAEARSVRANRDQTYRGCLGKLLDDEGYTID